MAIHPIGYYAWKQQPLSERAQDDQRLLGLLKQAWLKSGGIYGYRKLPTGMRDLGETCGKPAMVTPNHLNTQFMPDAPNQSWVTDITYIPTKAGCIYPS